MFKLITILPLLITLFVPQLLLAQSPSPEATTSAVEEIRSAVKQKVKQKLNNVTNRPVGIVGTIKNITENTLAVTSGPPAGGNQFTVTTAADTQYIRIPGKKTVDRSELGIDQTILILGYLPNDGDTVDSRIIQLIPAPEPTQHQTISGPISEFTAKTISVTQSDNQTFTANLTKTTQYTQKLDNQTKPIKSTTIPDDSRIILGALPAETSVKAGLPDPKKAQTFNAIFVHVLSSPQSPSLDATKSATPQ